MIHGEKIEQLVIDAGFVDVNVRKLKIELGDWGSGLSVMYEILL